MNRDGRPATPNDRTRHTHGGGRHAGPHDEYELAWDIVEHGRSLLSVAELNTVFIKLGCDDYMVAIDAALTAIARERVAIPHGLARRLARWVDMYEGHPSHRRLNSLIVSTGRGGEDPSPAASE